MKKTSKWLARLSKNILSGNIIIGGPPLDRAIGYAILTMERPFKGMAGKKYQDLAASMLISELGCDRLLPRDLNYTIMEFGKNQLKIWFIDPKVQNDAITYLNNLGIKTPTERVIMFHNKIK